MTENINTEDRTSPNEVSILETTQGADTGLVSSVSVKMIPESDLDALRSVKDREVSSWRKKHDSLEAMVQTKDHQLEIERDRRTTAETVASDAQRRVNLRNRARGLASQFFQSWGQDIGKIAENKLLRAENEQHLMSLYSEFIHYDLPKHIEGGSREEELVTRREDALSETVGISTAALGPSTMPEKEKVTFAAIADWIKKAKYDRMWKDSPDSKAKQKEARDILIGLGYPQEALPRRADWSIIKSAYETLKRFIGEPGESRKTKI